ncbi:MAG TPA: isochorismate synthase [Acidimicrobiia bacterium]|nr:isochorismate synthase [Acidimicrobiia bacterium]
MKFVTRLIDGVDDPLRWDPTAVWMSPEISLWGWGEAARIDPGPGEGRFEAIVREFRRLLAEADVEDPLGLEGTGPVVFASAAFADGSPSSVAAIPEVLLGRRHDAWFLTTVDGAELPDVATPEPATDRARFAGSSVPDVLWLEAVADAVRRIDAGELDKVVLARDYAVWSRERFHPPRILRHLLDRFPTCFVFRVVDLVGASPELLARRRGTSFESLVLAGSAPRHADPVADAAAGEGLLDSDKDQWEHALAVRSVRSSLEGVCDDPTIPGEPRLVRLDNVQHLATPVAGRVGDGIDVLGLAARLHPTAAVGGTPTQKAVALIAEIEGMDRGRYAGPVGWMDGRGDGEFAIALRCAELSGARARLFAGAGIVTGSLPEAELEETRIKLKAMMGSLRAS